MNDLDVPSLQKMAPDGLAQTGLFGGSERAAVGSGLVASESPAHPLSRAAVGAGGDSQRAASVLGHWGLDDVAPTSKPKSPTEETAKPDPAAKHHKPGEEDGDEGGEPGDAPPGGAEGGGDAGGSPGEGGSAGGDAGAGGGAGGGGGASGGASGGEGTGAPAMGAASGQAQGIVEAKADAGAVAFAGGTVGGAASASAKVEEGDPGRATGSLAGSPSPAQHAVSTAGASAASGQAAGSPTHGAGTAVGEQAEGARPMATFRAGPHDTEQGERAALGTPAQERSSAGRIEPSPASLDSQRASKDTPSAAPASGKAEPSGAPHTARTEQHSNTAGAPVGDNERPSAPAVSEAVQQAPRSRDTRAADATSAGSSSQPGALAATAARAPAEIEANSAGSSAGAARPQQGGEEGASAFSPATSPGASKPQPAGDRKDVSPGDRGGHGRGQAAQGTDKKGGAGPAGGAGAGSPRSAEADAGFQAVKGRVLGAAKVASTHAPAGAEAAAAQEAAVSPSNEIESQAAARHLGEMQGAQPQPFNRAAFKSALLDRIAHTVPNTLEEADDWKGNNRLGEVREGLSQHVKQGKQEAQAEVQAKAQAQPSTAGLAPRVPKALQAAQSATATSSLGAGQAAPKPKSEAEVSLSEGPRSLEQQMAEAKVTEPQLVRSNEPQFQSAVAAKRSVDSQAQASPPAYRQAEQATLTQAQAQSEATAQAQVQGMQAQRGALLGQVMSQQLAAKTRDEQARAQVSGRVQQIFEQAKQRVQQRLDRLDGEVNAIFERGAAAAKQAFEGYVDSQMRVYKDARYSGVIGKGRWVKDKLLGLPGEVNAFFQQGKQQYLAQMDAVLDQIAGTVENGLREATVEVARGRSEVQKYVSSLPASLREIGQQAAQQIQGQFDQLEQSIRDKQEQLLDSLAQKYSENLKQLDERIEQMKAENRGLVDKAKELIGETVQTILKLKDMLLGVLARAAGVIGKILEDPIGFVGNLVAGAKAGLQGFVSNIGKHLQQGLLGWLTGQLGAAGIQMPESLDLKGIFSLVTQVLGLVWSNVRTRAVKILGERAVKALEQGSDLVQKLMKGGLAAVWEHVQGMVGDLKTLVLDQIKQFVISKIITAGVTWIVSLLNPASAFVKACKAIYDIVMFFIERAAQISELVNAVLDSIEAVAGGAIGAMASKIEAALGRALPVAISFLASLLGLGGISAKIQGILQRVRAPIEKAIDWVLKKAVELLKKAGKWVGDKVGGKDKKAPADAGKSSEQDKPGSGEDTEQSRAVKAKARAEMTQRTAQPLKSQAQLQQIIREVFGLLRPQGLKQLYAEPKSGQKGKFDVIAIASPPEKVDEAEVGGAADKDGLAKKIQSLGEDLDQQAERVTQLSSAAKIWRERSESEKDPEK